MTTLSEKSFGETALPYFDVGALVLEPVLQGYACAYNEPHWYQRQKRIEVFASGCFAASLAGGKTIRAQTDHTELGLLATTKDRLELLSDDDGLAFRLRLRPDNEHDMAVARLVALGQLGEMSVGYVTQRERKLPASGRVVWVLEECDLAEISIVHRGAVPGTFCILVDGRGRQSLRADLRTGRLREGAVTRQQAQAAASRGLATASNKAAADFRRALVELKSAVSSRHTAASDDGLAFWRLQAALENLPYVAANKIRAAQLSRVMR